MSDAKIMSHEQVEVAIDTLRADAAHKDLRFKAKLALLSHNAALTAQLEALQQAIAPGADPRTDFVAIAEISRRQAEAQEATTEKLVEAEARAEIDAA